MSPTSSSEPGVDAGGRADTTSRDRPGPARPGRPVVIGRRAGMVRMVFTSRAIPVATAGAFVEAAPDAGTGATPDPGTGPGPRHDGMVGTGGPHGSGGRYRGFNLSDHVGDDPSRVRRHRERLAAVVDVPPPRLLFPRQVHGADVAVVDGPWQLSTSGPPVGSRDGSSVDPSTGALAGSLSADPPAVDVVVTRTPGIAVAVLAADCVPVVLADPAAGVVGVVHAGRAGLAAGVLAAAVTAVRDQGGEQMHAWIGPAVCGRCYEVPSDLREEVAAVHPAAWATTRAGTPSLDLVAATEASLRADDVAVQRVGGCTVEDQAWFSHRRDGVTGRHAAVAWLSPGSAR